MPLKANAKNIRWQIRARKQIQELMLRQWSLLEAENDSILKNRQYFYQMTRMVQTAFSLWRSAFLTNVESDHAEILKHQREFLERTLTTNAIGFSEEFGRSDFTVAYYNNNAKYRLERECKYDKELKHTSEFQKLLEIGKNDDENPREQVVIWDICFDALNTCFSKFEERLTPKQTKK